MPALIGLVDIQSQIVRDRRIREDPAKATVIAVQAQTPMVCEHVAGIIHVALGPGCLLNKVITVGWRTSSPENVTCLSVGGMLLEYLR